MFGSGCSNYCCAFKIYTVADLFWMSQVFPLDYILITVITVYFVLTSMAGIRNMGIWFFWIRVRKCLIYVFKFLQMPS